MRAWTRTLVASAALTAFITTPAFANNTNYKDAHAPTFPITIPAMKGGFEFNVAGLYAQPNAAPFARNIGIYNATASTATVSSVQYPSTYLTSDYNWAFIVGGGYIFNNTGNDIQLNWEHLDNTSSDTQTTAGFGSNDGLLTVSSPVLPGRNFVLEQGDSATSKAKIKTVHDAVNLNVGQYVNFGNRLSTRWSIGARYAKIQGDLQVDITGSQYGASPSEGRRGPFESHTSIDNKFTGLGPDVGASANYMVWNGIGVVAASSGFLLPGRLHSTSKVNNRETATSSATNTIINSPNQSNVVIPGFDAKLGVSYTANWPSNKLDYLNLELGYTTTYYANVLNSTAIQSSGLSSDFSYGGPYVSMNLRFS